MTTQENSRSPIPEAEGAKFLERDFTQCFQMMRHYDGQITDIVKFSVTAYATIAGAALAFHKYGVDKGLDYRGPALAIVGIGLLLGLTLLGLVARNRTYFVLVTRYVNEHRALFLKDRPLGFANAARMYTNPTQPPYFDWRSSQELLLYSIAMLNAGLLGIGLFLVFENSGCRWWIVGLGTALLFVVQLFAAISYLLSREGKSASHAVFGRE